MAREAMHVASAGAGVFTPAGFAEALLKFGEGIRPGIVRALKQVGEVPKRYAVEEFVSQGIGHGIFGRNASGAYKLIKVGAVQSRGGSFLLSLELRGFAALQELGGRTLPHEIKPRRKKVLRLKTVGSGQGGGVFARVGAAREAFAGPSVSTRFLRRGATRGVASDLGAFARAVHHPGSRVPRHPFAAGAMQRASPEILAALENEIVRAGSGIGIRRSGLVGAA